MARQEASFAPGPPRNGRGAALKKILDGHWMCLQSPLEKLGHLPDVPTITSFANINDMSLELVTGASGSNVNWLTLGLTWRKP